MAKIERFEELQSWQKERKLANVIYQLTSANAFAKDFALTDQIRRSSGSVMHNIAEGIDAGSDAEFSRFLRIARRSASEVQSQLYLAPDREYIQQVEFDSAYQTCIEVKKLINGFLRFLGLDRSS
jgi:four helix bundle protein